VLVLGHWGNSFSIPDSIYLLILVVFEIVHFAIETDKMTEKKEHMKRRISLQVMLDIATYLT
jgi:hypothetical protein